MTDIQVKFPFYFEKKSETKRVVIDANIFPICFTKMATTHSGFILCRKQCIVLVHNDGKNMRIVTVNSDGSCES